MCIALNLKQCSKDKSLREFTVMWIIFKTKYYRLLSASSHMGGLHECIHRRPLTLSPTMLLSAEPSPELVREKVGGMCVKLGVLYWILQPPLPWPLQRLLTARVGSTCGERLSLGQLEQRALSWGQVGDVAGAGELESDVLSCLQLT